MDSTIIDQESIDELGHAMGSGQKSTGIRRQLSKAKLISQMSCVSA